MSRLKPVCACLFLFVLQLFGDSSAFAEEEGQTLDQRSHQDPLSGN